MWSPLVLAPLVYAAKHSLTHCCHGFLHSIPLKLHNFPPLISPCAGHIICVSLFSVLYSSLLSVHLVTLSLHTSSLVVSPGRHVQYSRFSQATHPATSSPDVMAELCSSGGVRYASNTLPVVHWNTCMSTHSLSWLPCCCHECLSWF